ncbi:hypothetical protein PHYC_03974 [Phycisphaerales bacterium]|nr:hypothetical protein PHYC_03974 [Phycisphaerales bacterium]
MIAMPFDEPRPANPDLARGWDAERDVAHDLGRAFADAPNVYLFHGLRFLAPQSAFADDYAQIDHLVLHPHGAVIIESKATGDGTGHFHIDGRGQWLRCPTSRQRYSIESPEAQASKQAEALRTLLDRASAQLLDKLAGILQKRFRHFPILPLVAVARTARVTGPGATSPRVMKAENVVETVRAEIDSHRKASGVIGLLLTNNPDRGVHTLDPAAMLKIVTFLLTQHVPAAARLASQPPPLPPRPPQPAQRPLRPEALTCRHCRSINVAPVFRNDYCLQCGECGKYTPLERACTGCGKQATIRKRGTEFFRACDKEGGCGAEVVFWSGLKSDSKR